MTRHLVWTCSKPKSKQASFPNTIAIVLIIVVVIARSVSGAAALVGVLSAGKGLREETGVDEVVHRPLRSVLSLPGPVDPASVALVCIKLGLNVLTSSLLIGGREVVDIALVFAIAGTVDVLRILAVVESAIVPRSLAEAVQPLRAVSERGAPLADDRPFVSITYEILDIGAGVVDVVLERAGDLGVTEDLVLMGVERDVVDATTAVHETIPVRVGLQEGIVDDED